MAQKTVLITGSSDGGIGAALSLAFHQRGYRVFATARDLSKMSGLQDAGIETLVMDVTSEESLKTAAEDISRRTGGSLDILVNNAGGGYYQPLTDADISEMKKLFNINVWSIVLTTQIFLPLLMKSKSALLVNNTSVAAVLGVPFQGPYNASKAAASMISENLRIELSPFGIKVVDLRTGSIKTNFFENFKSNGYSLKLPPNSLYGSAREFIETQQIGGENVKATATPPDVWAKQVINDLEKRNPPILIWRGANAWTAWLSTFLPVGTTDGFLKSISGLSEVEKKLKQQK